MQDDRWIASFVAHLTAHSLLSLEEAMEVARRVYAQALRLSPESAAKYVLESGLVRRLDQLGHHTSGAAGGPAPSDSREPFDSSRRRSDKPSAR
jgi:hypothetical protein